MLMLPPAATVSYEVKCAFLCLSILEFVVGTLANAFIFSVNFRDVVRRQPLSNCDLVLLSLSLTRLFLHVLLFLYAIQLTHFQQMEDPLRVSYQTIVMLWMIANQAGFWIATCLSLLYCSKIVRFSCAFLLCLATWTSRKMPQMLLGSILLTSVCTVICSWDYFSNPHFMGTTTLFTNNGTEFHLQIEKLSFFNSFLFCNLGSIPPFLCFVASSGVLIVSLWQHMRTMRAKTRDSRDPSLEAHIKALKSLISFFFLYVVSLCAALLSMPLLILWHNKIGVMVCVGIMAACPSGHAAIVISGNAKLRAAVDAILLWARTSLKVRAEHQTVPLVPGRC